MLLKNFSFTEALWKIPLRILLDWLFACKSILQKDIKSFAAVFKAHASVLKWIITRYNQQQLPSKKIKKMAGVFNGSLIWSYFIQKKKHFSEIVEHTE